MWYLPGAIRFSSGGRRIGGVLGSPYRSPREAKYPECLPLADTNIHPESGGPLFEEFTNCLFWQHSNGARVGCDQGFPSPSTNRELWEWILGLERQISLQTQGGVWKVFLPTHPLPRPRSSHLNLEARAAPPLASHFPRGQFAPLQTGGWGCCHYPSPLFLQSLYKNVRKQWGFRRLAIENNCRGTWWVEIGSGSLSFVLSFTRSCIHLH